MFWQQMQRASSEDFKRATGVNRAVFEELMVVVRSSWQHKIARQRKPAKLSLEDKVLMLLMFYREYRTFYHIGLTYGIQPLKITHLIN